MKKLKAIIILIAGMGQLFAQPWGEKTYGGYGVCSDGSHLVSTPGFIMGGYYPSGTPNFYAHKTDIGGAHNGGSFWESDYTLNYIIASCTSGAGSANDCFGVSIIETSGGDYAVAGSTSEGCFYARLNGATGAVVNQGLYRFPAGATDIIKPIIVETPSNPDYMICGFYKTQTGGVMYVISIAGTGAVNRSRGYNVAANLDMIPYDMIVTPYTPASVDELVIVGRAHDISGNAGFSEKGFLIRLNQANLNVIGTKIYGQVPVPFGSGDDHFNAITLAASTTGGSDGYVVSGYSDSLASGKVWAIKLDRTGNRIWSIIHEPSGDPNAADPVGVIERLTSFGYYSYYIATESNVGMTVLKLDDFGKPFYEPSPDDQNEFVYNSGTPVSSPVAISFDNSLTGPDKGIHVYGNDNAGANNYFVEAAFNGWEDFGTCTSSSTTYNNSYFGGPKWEPTVSTTTVAGLTRCLNFNITAGGPTAAVSSLCSSSTLPPAGSNSKGTSIQKIEQNRGLKVSPNPTRETIQISEITETGKIRIVNVVGTIVFEMVTTGEIDILLNLKEQNLEPGIYFLNFSNTTKNINCEFVLMAE